MRLACLLLVACAARLPEVPGQGGPAWLELRSPHFTVWTDASPPRARALVQEMEHLRSIIYGVAFPHLPPGGVTFVILFHDIRESRVFTPPYHDAFAVPAYGSPISQPLFVLQINEQERVVTHELTHAISFNAIHKQPQWFAEGLATYFETIRLDARDRNVDVGKPPPWVLQALARWRLLPTATLLACTSCQDDQMFYPSAWTLVAYLRNAMSTQFEQFEQALAHAPQAQAWQQAFGSLSPAQLDLDMSRWLTTGGLSVFHYTIELQSWPVTERPLSDADVYASRALLGEIRRHPRSEIAANLAAAIRLDPTNVMARDLEADVLHGGRMSLELARQLVAAHPDHWIAWARLYTALHHAKSPEADAAQARLCELVLQNPALAFYDGCAKKFPPLPVESR